MLDVVCAVPYSLDSAPSQRYRWEQWAPHLENHGVLLRFLPFSTPEIDHARGVGNTKRASFEAARRIPAWTREMLRARHADLLVVHRNAALAGPPIMELLLDQLGVPFVFDFDDAIHLTQDGDTSVLRKLLRAEWRVDALCRRATLVSVGNSYLAEYAARVTRNVTVIATTVDVERYVPGPPKAKEEPVVVGWSGSPSTARYLAPLLPTLRRLQERQAFRLLVVGAEVDLTGLDAEFVPWTSAGEIPELQRMDIGIMPLPDNEWTRGKCALKSLLYSAVGIPSVVSDVGVNRDAVLDGRTGFVVHTPEEWTNRLSLLIRNAKLRASLGLAARNHAVEKYSAQAWAPRIADRLRACARHQP